MTTIDRFHFQFSVVVLFCPLDRCCVSGGAEHEMPLRSMLRARLVRNAKHPNAGQIDLSSLASFAHYANMPTMSSGKPAKCMACKRKRMVINIVSSKLTETISTSTSFSPAFGGVCVCVCGVR